MTTILVKTDMASSCSSLGDSLYITANDGTNDEDETMEFDGNKSMVPTSSNQIESKARFDRKENILAAFEQIDDTASTEFDETESLSPRQHYEIKDIKATTSRQSDSGDPLTNANCYSLSTNIAENFYSNRDTRTTDVLTKNSESTDRYDVLTVGEITKEITGIANTNNDKSQDSASFYSASSYCIEKSFIDPTHEKLEEVFYPKVEKIKETIQKPISTLENPSVNMNSDLSFDQKGDSIELTGSLELSRTPGTVFRTNDTRDSGMSISTPDYVLESEINMDLLKETLEDDFRVTPDLNQTDSTSNTDKYINSLSELQRKDTLTESVNLHKDSRHTNKLSNDDCSSITDSFLVVTDHHSKSSTQSPERFERISRTTSLSSTYTFDGERIDSECSGFEQPSMEYDDGETAWVSCDETYWVPSGATWTPGAVSSPLKGVAFEIGQQQKREKIIIRELSFDDNIDVNGVDLMAPVFLAVTNEEDDNVFNLRRKAKSIEDLCSTIDCPEERLNRRRTKSLSPLAMSIIMSDDNLQETNENFEEVKERLTSLSESLKSNHSYEDVRAPPSIDLYNSSSIEFEIPDRNDFFPTPELNRREDAEITFDESLDNIEPRIDIGATSSGFWEYPCSPSSPASDSLKNFEYPSIRSSSCNTSPNSISDGCHGNNNTFDRLIVVSVAGQQRIVDMKLIEPYLKILTHGGHHVVNGERHVIVVLNACYLPKRNVQKYRIIMEQLFYYCVHALELMVSDTYEIVFFNSSMDGSNIPPRHMIKQCYDTLQYRLRKNLKNIFFVHPSLLLKTLLGFTRFFVSSKFRRKMVFVKNLKILKSYLPVEYIFISPELHQIERKFK